ncbi:MAG TPA: trehalase-like domain-containing protein [Gaiellaceae bacterium]|nr:trehalase-like domain-containing protein [Gaiellaceae bacterium]
MRIDGYLPLRDYAIVGDGRATALVGRDGSIDWLCLPRPDSPPVLDRLLDAEAGGCFALEPDEPYDAVRRYRAGTNVLETTFTTASGSVRVTDAMIREGEAGHELVRLVDGRSGAVPMRWRLHPRFDFGRQEVPAELELRIWDAGDGAFRLREGGRATYALVWGAAPLGRDDVERRVERRRRGGWTGAAARSTTAPGASRSSAAPWR